MPAFDPGGAEALDRTAIAGAWFIWIDFVDDPLRVTTYDKTVTFAGTGDADLDGETFTAFDGRLLDVGDISNSDSGSDTLTIQRSGLPSIDAELLDQLEDRARWYGRTARIWLLPYDESGTAPLGAIVPWYTGYASRAPITPGKESQTAAIELENYLAAFNQASNRSYLNQKDYDPADNSAQATLAAANMSRGAASGGGGGGGGPITGGFGGGFLINSVRPL